jgi:hypothetical protein
MNTARRRAKRIAVGLGLGAVTAVFLIQLVPYGRDHTNPPVVAEPSWDRPATRALAERACFDCHSNRTSWPWYSHVAPASWLVQSQVDEGRQALNFSEWQGASEEADEAGEAVREREMPPASYLVAHPEARLTAAERDDLARGLVATAGGSYRASGGGEDTEEDDDD